MKWQSKSNTVGKTSHEELSVSSSASNSSTISTKSRSTNPNQPYGTPTPYQQPHPSTFHTPRPINPANTSIPLAYTQFTPLRVPSPIKVGYDNVWHSQSTSRHVNYAHKEPKVHEVPTHQAIPPTIREGQNKFHGLPTPSGYVDPEEYIHPNYWKHINTITEKAKEKELVKRAVLSAKITWKGDLSTFSTFKSILSGHCKMAGAGYIVNNYFLELYEKHEEAAIDHWKDKTLTLTQLIHDREWLYGMIEGSVQGSYGLKYLMQNEQSQDGIKVWIGILSQCDRGGNKDLRIQILEQEVTTPYHNRYKGGLHVYLNNFETSITELAVVLKIKEWEEEATQKRRLLQNLQSLNWKWLDPFFTTMTMSEIYQMLRKIALKEEYSQKTKYSNLHPQMITTQANIAHVEPDLWSKLPTDIKQLILRERRKEAESKAQRSSSDQNRPKIFQPPTNTTQANLTETTVESDINDDNEEFTQEYTPEHLATIEEFLGDTSDDDENITAHALMTKVLPSTNSILDVQEPATQKYLPQLDTWGWGRERQVRTTGPTIHNVYLRGDTYKRAMNLNVESVYKKCIVDNGADTSVIGQGWLIVATTTRRVNVVGFDKKVAIKRNLPVVTAIGAVDISPNVSILIRIHEAVYNESSPHLLLSDFQVRSYVPKLCVIWKGHGGKQVLCPSSDTTIPLYMQECMMTFKVRTPSSHELTTQEIYDITSDDIWDPTKLVDDPFELKNFIPDDEYLAFNTSKMEEKNLLGQDIALDISLTHGIYNINSTKSDPPTSYVNFFGQLPDQTDETNAYLHQALPSKWEYRDLAPHFAFQSHDIIRETLKRTTQLAKTVIRFPMRKHFQSRFKMLWQQRLNEVVSTDTYFSSTRSIEGYFCAQAFYGCTSRFIEIYGMRTESEFPSVYKDFLREKGIPHTLRRDNARSEASHAIQEIHQDLLIKDEWTEPHHPHQNPVEGGAIKFLKSRSTVLMDRTNTPAPLWFLCHRYLADVHNVCANPSNNWKVPNQVSGGIHKTFPIFYNLVGCNQYCIWTLLQVSPTVMRNLVILLDLT